MKPHSIGRTLGIGLRVAGRMAGQRLAAGAEAAANGPDPRAALDAAAQSRAAGQAAGQITKGVARGVGGFLRPFRRVGGILWLEVTGVFFFLFAVVFAWFVWQNRASFAEGPGHRNFLVSAGIAVLFLYLGVSSFWRAGRK